MLSPDDDPAALEFDVERSERFSRQMVLPEVGARGTLRLTTSRVAVVGCGGLGTPVIQYLASAGVGHLTVIDDDVVELSNLNRQTLHRHDDVGRLKAERAAEFIQSLDPEINVTVLGERITVDNARELCRDHDLILDCTDGVSNKYLLNDACVIEKTTLVHGGVTAFAGQVIVIEKGVGPCLRCLFPEIPSGAAVPSCREAGVLGAACGVVGSIMALEAIKLLCGLGTAYRQKYCTVDLLLGTVSTLDIDADPDCRVCGAAPRLDARRSQDYIAVCDMDLNLTGT
jgi:molybdopterin/thiamine biosynthesis adenylyltransferase